MNAKTFAIASLATLAIVALPCVASAAPINSDVFAIEQIEWRLDRQQRRIDNGRIDGSLTRGEYRSLLRANRRINRKLNRALFDGFLTVREENRLTFMLEDQSMRIRRLKNNRRFARMHRGFRGDRIRPNRMHPNRLRPNRLRPNRVTFLF